MLFVRLHSDLVARRTPPLITAILMGLQGLSACRDAPHNVPAVPVFEGAPLAFSPQQSIQKQFGRVGDVVVAADGRVFVGDVLNPEIWCFDSLGHFIGRLGRRGQGPGEFKSVTSLAVSKNRLFALDAALERITVFPLDNWSSAVPADLELETFPAVSPSRMATAGISATSGGNVLVQLALPIVNYNEVSAAPRLLRLFSQTGAILRDSVGTVPNDEHLVTREAGGYSVSPMPFGKRSIVRVGPDDTMYELWTGDTSVSVFNPDGGRSRILAIPGLHRRPVTSADLAVMRASIVGDGRTVIQRILGEQFDKGLKEKAIPDSMPTVSDFVVDDHGGLWFTPVTDSDEQISTNLGMLFRPKDGQTQVRMLDPITQVVRSGQVPLNGRLEAVAGGRLYFVTWDSLDVESIQVFEVEGELK